MKHIIDLFDYFCWILILNYMFLKFKIDLYVITIIKHFLILNKLSI